MHFRFKQTGYKCVGADQCVFSVITAAYLAPKGLSLFIYMLSDYAMHFLNDIYIKTTLLSGLASFPGYIVKYFD